MAASAQRETVERVEQGAVAGDSHIPVVIRHQGGDSTFGLGLSPPCLGRQFAGCGDALLGPQKAQHELLGAERIWSFVVIRLRAKDVGEDPLVEWLLLFVAACQRAASASA